MKTRFRSRHAAYRFRGLQFSNFTAETDDAQTVAAAQRDPHFGQGRDFWVDVSPPKEVRANKGEAEGRGAGFTPEPITRAQLKSLRKGELLEMAAERGIAVDEKATRDELVEQLATD